MSTVAGTTRILTFNCMSNGGLVAPSSTALRVAKPGGPPVATATTTTTIGVYEATITPITGEEGDWYWEWEFTYNGHSLVECGNFLVTPGHFG